MRHCQPPKKTESKAEETKSPKGIEPTDDEILAQQDKIAAEIAKTQPQIGKLQAFSDLEEEYKNSSKLLAKIKEGSKKYSGLRRVRGDGNCFYRAYLFAILEFVRTKETSIVEFAKYVLASLPRLEKLGYSKLVMEEPHDTLIDILNWLKTETRSSDDLMEKLNDDNSDSYLVMYVRILTSAHLQTFAKQYSPYLQGKVIGEFVKQEVEGMGKESDYVQCVALANELNIPLRIEYVDQSDGGLVGHVFPEKRQPQVFLLYRPGHYDLIYPKSA